MRVGEMFPSKYVAAPDLQGQDVAVTISLVKMEEVGSGSEKELLPVMYFQGMTKGMVLNKTNANVISNLYGEETDLWVGKPITLYPTETDYQGKMTPCIRVRSQLPQGALANPAPAPEPTPAPQPAPASTTPQF